MCRLLFDSNTMDRIVYNRHLNTFFLIDLSAENVIYPDKANIPVKKALQTSRSAYLCQACKHSEKTTQKTLSKQVSRALKTSCPDDIVSVLTPHKVKKNKIVQ